VVQLKRKEQEKKSKRERQRHPAKQKRKDEGSKEGGTCMWREVLRRKNTRGNQIIKEEQQTKNEVYPRRKDTKK